MPDHTISKVTLSAITWDTPPRQFKPAIASISGENPQLASDSSSANTASSGASNTLDQVQIAAVNPALPVLSPPQFTTVAGKSYLLSVEEAAGTFMASVSAPPEISASGSSAQAAEDNLAAKLDTLA